GIQLPLGTAYRLPGNVCEPLAEWGRALGARPAWPHHLSAGPPGSVRHIPAAAGGLADPGRCGADDCAGARDGEVDGAARLVWTIGVNSMVAAWSKKTYWRWMPMVLSMECAASYAGGWY